MSYCCHNCGTQIKCYEEYTKHMKNPKPCLVRYDDSREHTSCTLL